MLKDQFEWTCLIYNLLSNFYCNIVMSLQLYWGHFQDPWEYPPHFPAPHWAWSVHQWPQPHLSPAVFTVTCMDTRHTECCLLGAHLVCQLGRETHQTVAAAQACCTLDQPQGWYKLVGCFWVSKSKCNHSWTISHIIYMTQNSFQKDFYKQSSKMPRF